MQERIVFVVEKPSAARALGPIFSARWPASRVYAIATLRLGLYEFRYPRGLSFTAFPYIEDPIWKPRAQASSPSWSIDAGTATRIDSSPADLLRHATTIIFAGDPDASGAIAYHVLLSQCLGLDAAALPRPALRLHDLDSASIEMALDADASTGDAWFAQCLNAGLARRFFDFNFNVNALALLGASLSQVPGNHGDFTVSKYGLQLLYEMRERTAMSEGQIVALMCRWPGTGRHASTELGSPASRPAIVSGLVNAGLLSADGKRRMTLSEPGQAFLSQLHPDCQDPDLPARIQQWESAWPASRPVVERYLRTFFGKQKRYAARGSMRVVDAR